MKIKLKDLEEANEKLRKYLKVKPFLIKNNTIVEHERQMKAIKAKDVAMKEELDHLKKEGTQEVAFTWKVCFRKLKTELPLKTTR